MHLEKKSGRLKVGNMKKYEKSWLAGVIDGEGSIMIYDYIDRRGWRNRHARIEIVNTNKNFIERAGKLLNLDSKIIKQVRGKNRKPLYRARQANHKKVLSILTQILPYLIIKKNKAIEAIDFIKRTDWGKRRFSSTRSESLRKSWKLRNIKWAINYDKCLNCGTTKFKHFGHGLCSRCYMRRWHKSHESS